MTNQSVVSGLKNACRSVFRTECFLAHSHMHLPFFKQTFSSAFGSAGNLAQFVSLQKLSFLIILSIGEIFISICLTPVSHFIWKSGEKEVLFLSPFKHQNLSSIFLFYPHSAFFSLSCWKNEYIIQVKERALQCCCVSSLASSSLVHTRPFLGQFLLQGTELAEMIPSYNAPELVNLTL